MTESLPLPRPCEPAGALAATKEDGLGGAAALVRLGHEGAPGSRRPPPPGLRVVGEQRLEDRLDVGAYVCRLDGDDDLDPMVEVARHQVGAAEQVRLGVARLEAVEAAVLEEAAENRADADALADPFDAGP